MNARETGGREVFPAGRSGTTQGTVAGSLDRRRGTPGPRSEERLSPEQQSARAMAAARPASTSGEAAVEDKALHERLPQLDNDELARLTVLEPGTALEQGGVYLDLNNLRRGPIQAIGGQTAGPENRSLAKRDTDYDLWNRLAGQQVPPELERPAPEAHG